MGESWIVSNLEELESIGMVWDAFSEKWERGFAAAAQYYAEHGNLIMPVTYTTKDGLRLGVWVRKAGLWLCGAAKRLHQERCIRW